MKIFVFGSNLAGRHGKGAALEARKKWGAIYGVGVGPQGHSYAIPTKDEFLAPLSLEIIQQHVLDFIAHAVNTQEDTFILTRIGCGLAGYKDHQIAPMFQNVPSNVVLPDEWKDILSIPRGLTMDDLYNVA